jgi:hypothetical protein
MLSASSAATSSRNRRLRGVGLSQTSAPARSARAWRCSLRAARSLSSVARSLSLLAKSSAPTRIAALSCRSLDANLLFYARRQGGSDARNSCLLRSIDGIDSARSRELLQPGNNPSPCTANNTQPHQAPHGLQPYRPHCPELRAKVTDLPRVEGKEIEAQTAAARA